MNVHRHFGFLAATLLVASSASVPAFAATLILHYDFNDPASWNGTTLSDLNAFGSALTPDDGTPRIDTGPAFVAADFGTPTYTANGAITPVVAPPGFLARDRAFLDFTKFGVLGNSGKDQNNFNTPAGGDDGTNANVAGYSLEGFFLMRTGYAAAENGGLGFAQQAGGENQLIRIPRGTNLTLFSNSAVDNTAGGGQSPEQVDQNINAITPKNLWFHIVKVHDPVADQIRFYINGVLQGGSTVSLDGDSSAVEYHSNDLRYGNASVAGRELKNVGYSMTRYYRGALTDAEILANFQEVAFTPIPEPSTAALSIIGSLCIWARRRRKMAR